MDTHLYDGKLRAIKTTGMNTSDKRELFQEFRRKLKSQMAKHALEIIIRDMMNENDNNYDDKSNVDCTDTLVLLCRETHETVEPFVEEQLADILGGQCPQGRTSRIQQCLDAVKGSNVAE